MNTSSNITLYNACNSCSNVHRELIRFMSVFKLKMFEYSDIFCRINPSYWMMRKKCESFPIRSNMFATNYWAICMLDISLLCWQPIDKSSPSPFATYNLLLLIIFVFLVSVLAFSRKSATYKLANEGSQHASVIPNNWNDLTTTRGTSCDDARWIFWLCQLIW